MKVLIDLNVILDFLNMRAFWKDAAMVLDLVESRAVAGHVSAHEITTLSYFLGKKGKSRDEVRDVIGRVLSMARPVSVTELVLQKALASPVDDYEDAILEVEALDGALDYIVTRNVKDFAKARVEAITPGAFIALHGSGQ